MEKGGPVQQGDDIIEENRHDAELSRILKHLRPFQREAYDFATEGVLSSRQWSSSSPTSSSSGDALTKDETEGRATKKEKNKKGTPSLGPASPPASAGGELLGRGKILLADEMGLGKSVTSLAIMARYRSEWPLLILCPASLRHTWPGEIEKFLPGLPPSSVYVVQGFDDADFFDRPAKRGKVQIVIATYSLLQRRSAAARVLDEFNFRCVIADESHNLKDRTSQRAQLAMPLLQRADRLVLLSGTPALARPVELWTQVHVLAPELFGSYASFTKEHCNARRGRFGWDVGGLSNADALHGKLRRIMVRRLKADVLDELPAKQRSVVAIAIPKSKRKECETLMRELKETRQSVSDLVGDEAGGAHFEARRLLMQAYQASGVAKAEGVCEYLLEWLRGSGAQKVLVFAHHKTVLDAAEAAVAKELRGAGHIRIDGAVSSQERAVRVRKFQTSSQIRVAILSMTAAGVGLTLTAASCVMFAELHWTPGVLAQAEDRCHRIGQRNAVNVLYLVCEDPNLSVDMQLWQMLGRKVSNLGRVIDGERNASFDAQKASGEGRLGMSVQDELQSFFAEAAFNDEKNMPSNKVPVKGTIMSFFAKQQQQQSAKEPSLKSPSPPRDIKIPPFSRSATKDKIEWDCEACTYHNSIVKPQSGCFACEMCGTQHVHDMMTTRVNAARATQVTPVSVRIGGSPRIELCSTHISPSLGTASSTPKVSVINAEAIEIDCDDESPTALAAAQGDMDLDLWEYNAVERQDGKKRKLPAADEEVGVVSRKIRQPNSEEERETKIDNVQDGTSLLSFSVSKNSGRITIHYGDTAISSMINFEVEQIMTKETSDRLLEARVRRHQCDSLNIPLIYDRDALQCVVNRLDRSQLSPFVKLDALIEEIQSFVNYYLSLREIEKRFLMESGNSFSGINLRQAVLRLMTQSCVPSTDRYVGGAREQARDRMQGGTATEEDMAVLEGRLCAYCAGNLSSASRTPGVASTYCSRECAEQGRLKRGGMYSSVQVRSQVFALEGGVCRLCGIDAHALYTRIAALEPAERLNALCNVNWKLPKSAKALERLLQCPKEGDFWQADHIRAVAEGGGGCGLENLRTLCVPCHIGETEKLRGRLKLGTGNVEDSTKRQTDIRTMFGGTLTPRKPEQVDLC